MELQNWFSIYFNIPKLMKIFIFFQNSLRELGCPKKLAILLKSYVTSMKVGYNVSTNLISSVANAISNMSVNDKNQSVLQVSFTWFKCPMLFSNWVKNWHNIFFFFLRLSFKIARIYVKKKPKKTLKISYC